MNNDQAVKIFRSGPLYLVARGDRARLVSESNGVGDEGSLGGMVRHVHVIEPWEPVVENDPDLPEIVKRAVRLGSPTCQ